MYTLILHGKRLVQRVSVMIGQNANTFSNSFSSARSAHVSLGDVRKGENFTVPYLESLGFSTNLAEMISMKISLVDKDNPDSVRSLVRMTVSTVPENLEKKGGGKTLGEYLDFVKYMVKGDKSSNSGELCHSFPKAYKIRNILTLRELGVPQERLSALLMSKSGSVLGIERFDEILKKLVELGFDPTSKLFIRALKVLKCISNQRIEEKVQFYTSVGFTVDDVWEIFKKNPIFLELSEKKVVKCTETFLDLGFSRDESVKMIMLFPACTGYSTDLLRKKIEFMVKEMKWPVEDLVSFPTVLGYSMETRIVPRCNVIKVLMLKRLLGKFPSLAAMLTISNEKFIKRFVAKHDDKKLKSDLMALLSNLET